MHCSPIRCAGVFCTGARRTAPVAALLLALVLPSILLAAPAGPAWSEPAPELVPETPEGHLPLLVECADPTGLADRVRELGGRVTYQYENFDGLAFTLPKEAVLVLLSDPRVRTARRQRLVHRTITPLSFPEVRDASGLRRRAPEGEEIAVRPARRAGMSIRPVSLEEVELGDRGSEPVSFLGYDYITGAADVWDAADMGQGTIVGVIDTGVYPDHPMFVGNVIGGFNLVPREEEEAIDADGKGGPDGLHFDWDAVENNGHGTLITGMIAGHADLTMPVDTPFLQSVQFHSPESVRDEGAGMASIRLMGTAPGASIYAIKVFPYNGSGAPDARVVAAIDHLITKKRTGELDVDVVNMSLSGPVLIDGRNPLDAILDIATLHGITMVSAASNDGPSLTSVGSPGSAYTSLTVGAAFDPIHTRVAFETFFGADPGFGSVVFPEDRVGIIDFSSRGRTADRRLKPDIVATGFLVYSSTLADTDDDGVNDTPWFGFASGTSLSTPTVAGAAALVTAFADRHNPRYARSPYVANVLKRSSRPIADMRTVSSWEQGNGFVALPDAVEAVKDGRVSHKPQLANSHQMMRQLSIAGRSAGGASPDLYPGEAYQFLIDVPEGVSNLHFSFPTITLSARQNPIFGDVLLVAIHSAKRGGAGDYVFAPSFFAPIEPGDEFDYAFPEPGRIRVTMSGFATNHGPVSGSFDVVSELDDQPFPIAQVVTGSLGLDEMEDHEIEVPAGLAALAVRMSWPHDWRRFPTYDLDLYMQSPAGFHLAASLDAPELAWIESPEAGTWTFRVVDAGTARRNEPYKVEIAFIERIADLDEARMPDDTRPRVTGARPNPFRPSTEVSFVVPRAEHVKLEVYDVTGRLVRTLTDTRLEAGEHTVRWDGRSELGKRTSAGVYFLRLDTSQGSSSRKVILLN